MNLFGSLFKSHSNIKKIEEMQRNSEADWIKLQHSFDNQSIIQRSPVKNILDWACVGYLYKI